MSGDKCPVCDGKGTLPTGNYFEVDGKFQEERDECLSCGGSGRADGPPSAGPLDEDGPEFGEE